jgi:hypothetical protein
MGSFPRVNQGPFLDGGFPIDASIPRHKIAFTTHRPHRKTTFRARNKSDAKVKGNLIY